MRGEKEVGGLPEGAVPGPAAAAAPEPKGRGELVSNASANTSMGNLKREDLTPVGPSSKRSTAVKKGTTMLAAETPGKGVWGNGKYGK